MKQLPNSYATVEHGAVFAMRRLTGIKLNTNGDLSARYIQGLVTWVDCLTHTGEIVRVKPEALLSLHSNTPGFDAIRELMVDLGVEPPRRVKSPLIGKVLPIHLWNDKV